MKTTTRLLSEVPQFKRIFGDFIDPYKRMDYAIRNLPALRMYSDGYVKEYESWFINGEMVCDVIWPASLRRKDLQQLQDTMSSALLQQFRRITFFNEVENAEQDEDRRDRLKGYKRIGVPGLNELGKRYTVNKSLGFELSENQIVPLTQITVNFRVDLRIWDDYLRENLRTKDDPFEQTLGELEQIIADVDGLLDDETTGIDTVKIDTTIGD